MKARQEITEETVRIAGRGRTLAGVLRYPAGGPDRGALIAGPHPCLGGDMRNNVVTSLGRGLAAAGMVTLTFDYSGVGSSAVGPADWSEATSVFWRTGTIDEESDWAEDAVSAAHALGKWFSGPLLAIGYSFGSSVIDGVLAHVDAQAVVLVSPNPKRHGFRNLERSGVPLLVLHSDNDFTCGVGVLVEWFDSLRNPKSRVQVPAGEHFFRGCEEALVDRTLEFLNNASDASTERYGTPAR